MNKQPEEKAMPVTGRELSSFVSAFLIGLSWMSVGSFNVDTQFPIVFSGPQRSYFGYTVAMTLNTKGYIVLVGAPTANFTKKPQVFEPGVLFVCDINSTSCEEVDVTKSHPDASIYSRRNKLSYRMWLGGTLAVTHNADEVSELNDIVVCGHRHSTAGKIINGMCFLLDSDLKPQRARDLRPLDSSEMQYKYDETQFIYRSFYANGQVGMSAVYSKNGSSLMLGAPGLYDGTGTVVYYAESHTLFAILHKSYGVKQTFPQIDTHSYFGYSITTGKFFDTNLEQYAVGAPRDENHGKVYIIMNTAGDTTSILESKKGLEMLEYFGASVLGINVNGDLYTDLVVGAPLYASETGCDEGKVYIYISDGNHLTLHSELIGDGKSDARFGTSIAAIGDLNKDGFDDFAVGAPYEDGAGAVYIYYCTESGPISQHSQKIEAIQIDRNLAGFGIHIAQGFDIDGNRYPDLLVGSYVSANAVLLRSRPVIEVFLEIFFNPSKIKMNKAECVYNGKNLPCVHIDACLNYTGMQVPASLDFQCTLLEQDPNPRGFFFPYRYKNAAAERNATVKINTGTCLTVKFYLHSDIKDIVTPVLISFSCELAASTASNDTFESTYPMVSPFSVQNITSEIPFHSGCANDDVCYCDLVVEAELLGEAKTGAITLGNVSSVSIDITVRNEGEPAYSSELLIYLPPGLTIINKDFCETRQLHQVIACDVGNPLLKGKQVNIHIKLDVMKITPETKFAEIFLEGSTNSSETNAGNNLLTISLEVQTISDIGIRGTPSHHLIMHEDGHDTSSIINHKYTVRNYGPSPLQAIDIVLQVPKAILTSDGRKQFLYFTGLRTDGISENIVSAVCNDTSLDTEKFLIPAMDPGEDAGENGSIYYNESYSSPHSGDHIRKRSTMQKITEKNVVSSHSEMGKNEIASMKESGNFEISCEKGDFECVTLHCSATSFSDDRKFAEISIAFEIDYTVLSNYLGSWYQIEFLTTGSISVPDSDVSLLPDHSKVTRVTTVLHHGGVSPEEQPHWLFSASAIFGSMVLFLIVIILIKVGFFRRKEKEMLRRLEQSLLIASTDEEFLIDPCEEKDALNE